MIASPVRKAADLLSWLQQDIAPARPRRRVRLPVVVSWRNEHRLAIGDVFVGRGPDGIPAKLDDSGLGVALVDALRQRCPAEQASCALWLEGYWGSLIEGDPLSLASDSGRYPFAVLAVGELIDGTPAGDLRSQVDVSS